MIIVTVSFITLPVNWYNNRLLPLIRQFFLFDYGYNMFKNLWLWILLWKLMNIKMKYPSIIFWSTHNVCRKCHYKVECNVRTGFGYSCLQTLSPSSLMNTEDKISLNKFLVAYNLHVKHDYWNWMQYDNTVQGTIIPVSAKIMHQNFLRRNFWLRVDQGTAWWHP
jgi:hypothetical protein